MSPAPCDESDALTGTDICAIAQKGIVRTGRNETGEISIVRAVSQG